MQIIAFIFALLLGAAPVFAGPDDFVGDTIIFGGTSVEIPPNVLILLDSSTSMKERLPYDPQQVYPDQAECGSNGKLPCEKNKVYRCNKAHWNPITQECEVPSGNEKWNDQSATFNAMGTNCQDGEASLGSDGYWLANKILGNKECKPPIGNQDQFNYFTGNYINYLKTSKKKIDVAREIIGDLAVKTDGINIGLMRLDNQQGGKLVAEIEMLTTQQKRVDFNTAMKSIAADGDSPLAKAFHQASRYYAGEGGYASPIKETCQRNYVILISDGLPNKDLTVPPAGVCPPQGCTPTALAAACETDPMRLAQQKYLLDQGKSIDSLDHMAAGQSYLEDLVGYLYRRDHRPDMAGEQNVQTYVVGYGLKGGNSCAVPLLDKAARAGSGDRMKKAFLAMDDNDLAAHLERIFDLIREHKTSFSMPVAPPSPQNAHASGNRIYLGLFKPQTGGFWPGNLKKYAIDEKGVIRDAENAVAVHEGGLFRHNSRSFWSTSNDGGEVTQGGAGAVLLARDLTNDPRKIFTYLGETPHLSDAGNRFATTNAALGAAQLGVAAAERNKLIRFVHGFDAYDDNGNGSINDKRPWILGDILHSSPVVVRYNKFSAAQEGDPSLNKSLIFVGANDGQLHAFRDADGTEAWSFIPPVLLPDLQYLRDGNHTYYVDMSPATFVFDANRDGVIEKAKGDRVILMFGLRRGGGKDRLLSNQVRGAYYALDVSDPEQPELLWSITRDAPGFAELGETWSPPSLARMKAQEGGVTKDLLVAVFGAGYDNNEDLRFGNTQGFPKTTDTTKTTLAKNDAGVVTSQADGAQHHPRGRGIFAVKVGEFAGGAFTPAQSLSLIWSVTAGQAGMDKMTYSFPAEVAALDISHNGYVDRFYALDTGGQLWRIDARDAVPSKWKVERIFEANGGAISQKGRKFFYRPSVTVERNGQAMIFIGSGDREHPLNEAVTDRFYAVKDPRDRAKSQPAWDGTALKESDLVDVTENILQEDVLSAGMQAELGVSTIDEAIAKIIKNLRERDGWFIRLDQRPGEKALASPLVFNKVAYFTTFTPLVQEADPCRPGNLGVARVYVVDYLTGEAVRNYDPSNDDQVTDNNARAQTYDGKVLRRSDRERTLGSGIPSGVGVVVPDTGSPSLYIGCDGGICAEDAGAGSRVHSIYWLQR
ncbi:PilC/PilY family type IV pilus protein [Geoalkalibacter sp.]|uniref:PilC/PilY family type IV pilus protein n=1 Tax=Geoalkalibacter sp. TaxID=3041440 RepID=UPI00272DE564|nr:PilC/PilY family type IV pilus protein [Geoalkalibacter sp.]